MVDSGNYGPRRFYLPLDVEDAALGKSEYMFSFNHVKGYDALVGETVSPFYLHT